MRKKRSPRFSRLFGDTQSRRTPSRQRPQTRSTPKKKCVSSKTALRRKIGKILGSSQTILVVLLFTTIILGGVFSIAYFSVQNIKVSRTDVRMDAGLLGRSLQQYLGGSILLLSERNVESMLQQKFPQIQNVELTKIFPSTIRVTVSTHPVVFRWACEEKKKQLDEEGNIIEKGIPKLFYVDRNGMITLPDEAGKEAFLVYEKLPCPKKMKVGYQALLPEMVATIVDVKTKIEEVLKLPITRSGYYRDAREIHFYAENETAFWIDFSTPAEEQINKLKAALTLEPKLLDPMNHIDLRVDGKIFYQP